MGESRSNPRSPQFAGKLPAEMPYCGIEVRAKIKDEWTAANADAIGDPPPEAVELALMMVIGRTEPSSLYPDEPQRWPRSEPCAIGPVLIMTPNGPTPAVLTLEEFRRLTPINGRTAPSQQEEKSLSSLLATNGAPWKKGNA